MTLESDEQPVRTHAWPLGLRLAHWLLAFCVVAAASLAIYLVYPPHWSDFYIRRYEIGVEYHKLLGLAAFGAAIALALLHPLRPPRTGSPTERRLAAIVQAALILLAIAVPTAGYIANALYEGGVSIPGLITFASPFTRHEALGAAFTTAHDVGAYLLLALIALHLLAALRRQMLRKDPVITDMLGLPRRAAKDIRP